MLLQLLFSFTGEGHRQSKSQEEGCASLGRSRVSLEVSCYGSAAERTDQLSTQADTQVKAAKKIAKAQLPAYGSLRFSSHCKLPDCLKDSKPLSEGVCKGLSYQLGRLPRRLSRRRQRLSGPSREIRGAGGYWWLLVPENCVPPQVPEQ